MQVTQETVVSQYEWIQGRAGRTVEIINDVRGLLGPEFDTVVDPVTVQAYQQEVDTIFADGDLAINVTALVSILRGLNVQADYPGFIVDELLGRELAGMIAGRQPLRLLGEATFHYADVHVDDDTHAGVDDLDAALAAGFQTRLPGWEWTERESPFAVVD